MKYAKAVFDALSLVVFVSITQVAAAGSLDMNSVVRLPESSSGPPNIYRLCQHVASSLGNEIGAPVSVVLEHPFSAFQYEGMEGRSEYVNASLFPMSPSPFPEISVRLGVTSLRQIAEDLEPAGFDVWFDDSLNVIHVVDSWLHKNPAWALNRDVAMRIGYPLDATGCTNLLSSCGMDTTIREGASLASPFTLRIRQAKVDFRSAPDVRKVLAMLANAAGEGEGRGSIMSVCPSPPSITQTRPLISADTRWIAGITYATEALNTAEVPMRIDEWTRSNGN